MQGISSIQRLTRQKFLLSQMLSRKIAARSSKNDPAQKLKFLPQTYVSASFLMAFVPSSQIVAIPKGLRKLTQIYPHSVMELIPYDIDRYHTEILSKPIPTSLLSRIIPIPQPWKPCKIKELTSSS
jgi:iron complex transport system substrate-binding protein